ncbi:hypothetical protein SBA1_550108 [Candidatus Sulfotelmatobacter kueseliae]|uniref:Uncharacterized protein n=1 Tax=Candidatus Sulfotelmatobacter kueseliae TaxID=2042962 RepID=A0A2U3KYP9_9BACT|nr:hypothetical protein SBA1_550108 [Candidatus Sulfotelmatobacter kueseliae]
MQPEPVYDAPRYRPPTAVEKMRRHNRVIFSEGRRIIIQKAGGMIKARYEGSSNFVFGDNPMHAAKRLHFWE